MAFRQPVQRPQAPRHPSFSQPTPAPESVKQAATHKRRLEEEAQEWILFSPVADEQQSTTSRTSLTPRTANLSRISDLDSLDTGARSELYAIDDNDLTCQGTDLDDEEGELDSLDDGLHAFHGPITPQLDQSGGTVLPTHDGLGTFPSSFGYAPNEGMQEHLWQFERYNPHRRRPQRRRSSVQKRLDALNDEEEMHSLDRHEERRLRIEKWRLEQSRAVLEEIERETRRRTRRLSVISGLSSAVPHPELVLQDTVTQGSAVPPIAEDEPDLTHEDADGESFWQRITRRVIKDLMGLDETTLSVIFGEELASETTPNTPTQHSPIADSTSPSAIAPHSDATWEQRLLERIARELGILANRLSENEGAFSTYDRASRPLQPQAAPRKTSIPAHASTVAATSRDDEVSTNDALFQPTFPTPATLPTVDTSLWGIEEEPAPSTTPTPAEDREYWERDLDVGVIFRYLRNRFSSTPRSPTPATSDEAAAPHIISNASTAGPLPPAWASSSPSASALGTSPESFRRADMIRRHHPLVSHAASLSATRRRESILLRRQHQFLMMHRRAAGGSSSCASQSTKRTRSGGSRRYWDFPSGGAGSAAGGSAVSVTSGGYEGMMGSWGEV